MVLHAMEDKIPGELIEISERWAQELAFYFKNKEIDSDAFHSKGFGLSPDVFNTFVPDNKTLNGIIEFIFMKQ